MMLSEKSTHMSKLIAAWLRRIAQWFDPTPSVRLREYEITVSSFAALAEEVIKDARGT